jgi:Skp family chaperone for outer membrane proteins
MNKIVFASSLILFSPTLGAMTGNAPLALAKPVATKQAKVIKVAYVNIGRILPSSEYGEPVNFQDGSQEWYNLTKEYHDEIQNRVKTMRQKAERLNKLTEELETKKGKGQWRSDTALEKVTEEAMKLQSELQIEQQALQRYAAPIQKAQTEMTPKIQQIIGEIVQRQGWDIVLFGGVLFASPDADITQEVITALNTTYTAERKKSLPAKPAINS